MFCGQLQCSAGEEKPYFVDYGTQYQQISLIDKTCRLVASLYVVTPEGSFCFPLPIFDFPFSRQWISCKDRRNSGKERGW